MVEDVDAQVVPVTMILTILRPEGSIIKLSITVDEEDAIRTLYIPELDLSLHGRNLGSSIDGTLFRKFSFNLREEELHTYPTIVENFLSNGWEFSTESNLDGRVKN